MLWALFDFAMTFFCAFLLLCCFAKGVYLIFEE